MCGIGMREMRMSNASIQSVIVSTANVFRVDPLDIVTGKQDGKDLMYARNVCACLLTGKVARTKIPALLGRKSLSYYYEALNKVRARCLADHDFEMMYLNLMARLN